MQDHLEVWLGKIDETPLGPVWVATSETGIVAVSLWDDRARFEAEVKRLTNRVPVVAAGRTAAVAEQLVSFLHQEREQFDFPIDWSVLTDFQERVLRAVHAIPYGRLSTYGKIAAQIGNPKSVRAVGRANATNPIPIVIPCHRVIGSDGKLHGYGAPGGLETKAWLLRMEGSWLL
jgi:O-6-methylguanine DNA methyltransferase